MIQRHVLTRQLLDLALEKIFGQKVVYSVEDRETVQAHLPHPDNRPVRVIIERVWIHRERWKLPIGPDGLMEQTTRVRVEPVGPYFFRCPMCGLTDKVYTYDTDRVDEALAQAAAEIYTQWIRHSEIHGLPLFIHGRA